MCFFGKSKRFGAKRGGLPPFGAFLSRLLLLGLVAAAPLRADPPGYGPWAELLGRYVTPDGVRYEAWHADAEDRAKLDGVLDSFASVGRSALDDDTAAAFLINVYNAAMIQAVLREYPLSSVREIGSSPFAVFKKEFIGLDGETVSLDEVEKGILLEEYSDPRLHFAVNCASVSCPPLRAEPFRGADLDRQLGQQARLFANGPHAARVSADGDTTAYSKLFEWYADDFPGDDPAVYLNRFRDEPLPVGNGIEWIDYDWSLNEAP